MSIAGEWTVHGERSIYESEWMSLRLVDVETPSGKRLDHHVARIPAEAAATLVVVERCVLMIWRHRFVTDTWCWELPAGRIDPDETVAQAAARECREETGWQPGPTIPFLSWHPANGSVDLTFHVERATEAHHVGDPTELDEAAAIEWIPLDDIPALIRSGQVNDGFTLTPLLAELAGL